MSLIGTILPGIISGGAKLLGGMFGSNEEEEARKAEFKRQMLFAQNALQWKVADAKAAGVSPLYAIGAQTVSYQPQSVGGGYGMGAAMADMGQDISRSAEAVMNAPDRVMSKTLQALQLERAGLENDLLRSQIARANSGQLGPAGVGSSAYGADSIPLRIPTGGGGSVGFQSSPTTKAQTWEDQYGDVVQNVAGLWRLYMDTTDHAQKMIMDNLWPWLKGMAAKAAPGARYRYTGQ